QPGGYQPRGQISQAATFLHTSSFQPSKTDLPSEKKDGHNGTTDQRPALTAKGAPLAVTAPAAPVSVTRSRYSPGASFGGLNTAARRSGPAPALSRSTTRTSPLPASRPSRVRMRPSALSSPGPRL